MVYGRCMVNSSVNEVLKDTTLEVLFLGGYTTWFIADCHSHRISANYGTMGDIGVGLARHKWNFGYYRRIYIMNQEL